MHLAVGKKKKRKGKQVTLSMMSRLIEMQILLRRYLRKTISLSSNQDSTICPYHKVVSVLRSCLFSSCSRFLSDEHADPTRVKDEKVFFRSVVRTYVGFSNMSDDGYHELIQ